MNTFKQHIPAFVDVDERPPEVPFETTEDLLALEVVQRYRKRKNFSHFAMSEQHLMVISDDGFDWWVVGSIADPSSIDLPQWDEGKYRAQLPDGRTIELPGKDVWSSCGDELTLRDGSTARRVKEQR